MNADPPDQPIPDDHSEQERNRRRREQVRAGDHEAFDAVYREYLDDVFRLAVRLTGSRPLGEEVTSETFLIAWRNRADIEVDERPLRSWVLGITARQALNATRGLRRRWAFLARVDGSLPTRVDDFADEAASRLDDVETLRRTRSALASLPRSEVEVVGLCVWSGLSYVEAAAALDIPVGTVRSRLHRARGRLRALVDDAPPDRSPARMTPVPSTGSTIARDRERR